jgi:hypothetical protein
MTFVQVNLDMDSFLGGYKTCSYLQKLLCLCLSIPVSILLRSYFCVNVRSWHYADMAFALANVCFRGNSGRGAPHVYESTPSFAYPCEMNLGVQVGLQTLDAAFRTLGDGLDSTLGRVRV